MIIKHVKTAVFIIGGFFVNPLFSQNAKINRFDLVTRHNPVISKIDPLNPLSVGNGKFAFTVDATGLQTFPDSTAVIPLNTMAEWGWHSYPNPNGWNMESYLEKHPDFKGYSSITGSRSEPEVRWLRDNPHRFNLGHLGFNLYKKDGSLATIADISNINQKLDLWKGEIISRFTFDGEPVAVHTLVHPQNDMIAVRVVSPLLRTGRITFRIEFPYGSRNINGADWKRPEAHQTTLKISRSNQAEFIRTLDAENYTAGLSWNKPGKVIKRSAHLFHFVPEKGVEELNISMSYQQGSQSGISLGFDQTKELVHKFWKNFWESGGAVDLSESLDKRWFELERRIVLSQYLTAIQCTGKLPPQESGLTSNSWGGKFHLEMHWWHGIHYDLWNRLALFEPSLEYYPGVLPYGKSIALRQGYEGVRWPKMTGPGSSEAPSFVGPYLIWQQPHPIYFAELSYRAHPGKATLDKFKDVIFQTAAFMASYPKWDEKNKRYVLGPPLQTFQERYPVDSTYNPTFELTYWRWGLETAQLWRERLGLPREPAWDNVLQKLSSPPIIEDKYLFAESSPDNYINLRWREDNPSVLCALGMLPGPGIDKERMRNTLKWVWKNWNWEITWGPDYPIIAMCAARVDEPQIAIDALLMDTPKNAFLLNGHNPQSPTLGAYLPGNSGLLIAIAMMAAGWEGGPDRKNPGFPGDGRWVVKHENLRKML